MGEMGVIISFFPENQQAETLLYKVLLVYDKFVLL